MKVYNEHNTIQVNNVMQVYNEYNSIEVYIEHNTSL